MRTIKILFGTYFAMLSMFFLAGAGAFGRGEHSTPVADTHSYVVILLIRESLCVPMALVFGLAWWAVWWKRKSGKKWAITASFLSLLVDRGSDFLPRCARGASLSGVGAIFRGAHFSGDSGIIRF